MYRIGDYNQALCMLRSASGKAKLDLHVTRGPGDRMLISYNRDGRSLCALVLEDNGSLNFVRWDKDGKVIDPIVQVIEPRDGGQHEDWESGDRSGGEKV